MAVRRLVRECIEAGLAGLRLDDQPLEQKRRTMSSGISIVSREEAVTRYRAAVDAKNEIDANFVIMAQCYARNAVNGGMAELLKRLRRYEKEAGVDWVQFEAPHSVAEIKRARKVVKGPFSAMKGELPRALTLAEHKALGLNAAWYTFLARPSAQDCSLVASLSSLNKKDMRAWDRICAMTIQTRLLPAAKLPWDATRHERAEPSWKRDILAQAEAEVASMRQLLMIILIMLFSGASAEAQRRFLQR